MTHPLSPSLSLLVFMGIASAVDVVVLVFEWKKTLFGVDAISSGVCP